MESNRKVMITRRRRRRLLEQKPKIYLYISNLLILIVAILVAIVGGITLSAVGSAYAVYESFAQQLPDPTAIETEQQDFETTKIYDRTGQVLLYELFDPLLGDRNYIALNEIPEFCRKATVILEDKTFYENAGFDPEGIARAFVNNLRGEQVQGGSSITQQLIKNILIEEKERAELSYTRKIKEVILAMEITRRFPKDQILEWYFNTNSYSNLAYGIDAAARVYFDKPASALSDTECAMLAAVPQYPAYNPITNFDIAKNRQRITLNRMLEEEAITIEEAETLFYDHFPDEASYQELYQRDDTNRFKLLAPHFTLHVREELRRLYEPELIYRGGLRVYTTLDLDLNDKVLEIARRHVEELAANDHNASNACVVSIRPKTGEILAMVGSIDYWDEDNDGNVNVCTVSPGRQPGSSFKPFGYLTLFSQGVYNAASMVMDVRQAFPDDPNPPYVPENYDRRYHGPVRLRNALARSYNIPAVWVLNRAGVKNTINTAHRMGITTLNEDYYGLALVLGGGEVKPIDMAYAYSVLANLGSMAGKPVPDVNRRPGHRTRDPVSILRVEDKDGGIIYEYSKPITEQVVEPALAYLMTDILSDNEARARAFGINSDLKRGFEERPIAAKTGTTNNFRDNWTVGFTPQLATAVWVGNNNNEEMRDVTGLDGAAPIWNEVMQYYHQDKPVEVWEQPPGLVTERVDALSGKLPGDYTGQTVEELFLEGTVPTEQDDVHQAVRVNRENGKLATANTAPELIETRVYRIYPAVADDWVEQNNIPQPPAEFDDSSGGPSPLGPTAIISPQPYDYVREQVVIRGNVQIDDFQLYRVEVGRGLNPSQWQQIGSDHTNQVERGQLEVWNTRYVAEGLYTLQLTVLKNDQSLERKTVQVTVDNTAPQVAIIGPEPYKVFEDDDEWINIQVDAVDNFSIDHVEFFVNGRGVGQSGVSPYSLRWNIDPLTKRNIKPEAPVVNAQTVTREDGTVINTSLVTISQVIPITEASTTDPTADGPAGVVVGYQKIYSNGLTIVNDLRGGYTETNTIHAVAYDSAGNRAESVRIPISIIPEPEEEDEAEDKQSFLAPSERRLPSPAGG